MIVSPKVHSFMFLDYCFTFGITFGGIQENNNMIPAVALEVYGLLHVFHPTAGASREAFNHHLPILYFLIFLFVKR